MTDVFLENLYPKRGIFLFLEKIFIKSVKVIKMRHEARAKVVRLRPKRRKSYGFIIYTLILVAIAALVIRYYYIKEETYIVVDGTIKKSFLADALIIKKETVVTAEASGKLQLLVEPGERVRVNTPLFIITTDEKKKEDLQKQITELERQIKELRGVMQSSLPMNVLNKSIEDISNQLKDAVAKGEFERVDELKKELSRLNNEKQIKIDAEEANINALENYLNELKNSLAEVEYIQVSPASGIVSFNIDNLETILGDEKTKQISATEIQAVEVNIREQNIPSTVALKQPILKVVDNFSWQIAVEIKDDSLKEGKIYEISFPETQDTVMAKLENLHGTPQVGIFTITREIKSFADMRKTEVEIISDKKSGKLVPRSSIVSQDGVKGVYCLEEGRKKFKPVEILIEDETFAIVDGLKLGDKILLE